ncbi:MAG: NAD(P)/FAD-dependent oxidoreductase [Actinomycetota bacterium]|nr:NAD(P)/FAD-dependent oxidoreductase [Actinomycetota bacterium]MDQ6945692.1 NAD(P)/FAD-dependent oxidoreductase [Actinomycetota bacterium]
MAIVGAGFGGINATRELMDGPFDITLIDRDNYHGFWPLLYQVATAGLGPEDIAHPVRGMFGNRANIHFRLGTVSGIDFDRKLIHVEQEDDVTYDYLILAAGSSTSDFGIPGVDQFAFPLKTLPDAVRLRNHILTCFERADACPELVNDGILTIVLAGGGPTGVELAGALSELIGQNLARDFPHLDVTRARVVLVEMLDHLLGGFSPSSQAHALHTLQAKGIDVRLNTAIAALGADEVTFKDGSTIRCATAVWTAGIRANPLAERLDVPKGKGGAIVVTNELTVPGRPEVFVIGDLAAATDPHGKPYPQLAQVAIQGAHHVARTIERRTTGRPTKPFRYHNHGIMATIGRRAAVAELPGGLKFRGTIGWLTWLGVHLLFLVGFRNRVVVLVSWAWNYLSWDRASRVILDENSTTPSGQHRA